MSVYIEVLRGPQIELIHDISNLEFHNHSLSYECKAFKKREIIVVLKHNFLNNKMNQIRIIFIFYNIKTRQQLLLLTWTILITNEINLLCE